MSAIGYEKRGLSLRAFSTEALQTNVIHAMIGRSRRLPKAQRVSGWCELMQGDAEGSPGAARLRVSAVALR